MKKGTSNSQLTISVRDELIELIRDKLPEEYLQSIKTLIERIVEGGEVNEATEPSIIKDYLTFLELLENHHKKFYCIKIARLESLLRCSLVRRFNPRSAGLQ